HRLQSDIQRDIDHRSQWNQPPDVSTCHKSKANFGHDPVDECTDGHADDHRKEHGVKIVPCLSDRCRGFLFDSTSRSPVRLVPSSWCPPLTLTLRSWSSMPSAVQAQGAPSDSSTMITA